MICHKCIQLIEIEIKDFHFPPISAFQFLISLPSIADVAGVFTSSNEYTTSAAVENRMMEVFNGPAGLVCTCCSAVGTDLHVIEYCAYLIFVRFPVCNISLFRPVPLFHSG